MSITRKSGSGTSAGKVFRPASKSVKVKVPFRAVR